MTPSTTSSRSIDYGPIADGVLSTYTNSRFASGIDKNSGATVEVRLWDGGEPGKNTDRVGLTIGGTEILSGQLIDQGNMQYHANCRGPADQTVN